jgi:hypothetical protein
VPMWLHPSLSWEFWRRLKTELSPGFKNLMYTQPSKCKLEYMLIQAISLNSYRISKRG